MINIDDVKERYAPSNLDLCIHDAWDEEEVCECFEIYGSTSLWATEGCEPEEEDFEDEDEDDEDTWYDDGAKLDGDVELR